MSGKTSKRKALIFVSPGRCGTTRIAEILREKLPSDEFAVTHQMPFSRLANVAGNLMCYFGQSEKIKEKLYNFIVSGYTDGKHFITTDPLTAMIMPVTWVRSERVCIVHITRDPETFADSFFRFSRKKVKSFIAHNFIPFWQIRIFPLENLLNPNIKEKYRLNRREKERIFDSLYGSNPNFVKATIDELFQEKFIESLVNDFFNISIEIKPCELSVKANQS